jgi:two-component system response regulator FixJ
MGEKIVPQPRGKMEAEACRLVQALTGREREVLFWLSRGASNKAVARLLGISPRTVETHRSNLMRKLNTKAIASAVRIAIYAQIDGEGS